MPATTAAPAEPFRVRDAFPLPAPDAPLEGRARRDERYPVHVTTDRAQTLAHLQAHLGDATHAAVIADETANDLYGAEVVRALRGAGADVRLHVLPAGEATKDLDRAVALWHELAASPLGRRDLIVALGGGVTCDLAGWVASAYMRGIPYVNVPTTLLAQVDGALGGKVAVNHRLAKNLLGAFHQPRGVIADVSYLASLDRRHVGAGIAECVKKAVIASPEYWRFIDSHAGALLDREPDALHTLVRAAAAIKTALIERDPYEIDLRRPLNFGHTIGHPLETVTGYGPLLHGEAVAFGMVAETRIAAARGLAAPELLDGLIDLLRRLGLPAGAADLPRAPGAGALVEAMEKVRLIRAGSLRFVLPVALGETVIADDVSESEVRAALAACGVGW